VDRGWRRDTGTVHPGRAQRGLEARGSCPGRIRGQQTPCGTADLRGSCGLWVFGSLLLEEAAAGGTSARPG